MTASRFCDTAITTGLAHVVVSINTLIGLVTAVRQTALRLRANTRLKETHRSYVLGKVCQLLISIDGNHGYNMTASRFCDTAITTGLAHVVVSINALIGLVTAVRQTALRLRANTLLKETQKLENVRLMFEYSTFDHIGVVAMENPLGHTLQTCFVKGLKVEVKIRPSADNINIRVEKSPRRLLSKDYNLTSICFREKYEAKKDGLDKFIDYQACD
ncbi:hypothetical protein CLF_106292 [Clonorchis sinensis]|uniref:Uncharacterized protein n=1 Tax=Clonorchis sinensis TaxID=79923 RepID=G7YPU6_CLOSI|nr:hypothetical protein CLF_106292 [Clonorchis sinensis]